MGRSCFSRRKKNKEDIMNKYSNATTFALVALASWSLVGCATAEEAIGETISKTQRAALSGSEIVSSAGDRDGYAQAEVSVNDVLNQICYDINKVRNLNDITSILLNRGRKGQTGPVVLRFSQANEGGWKNCVKRSEWLEDQVEWKPGNYYVQISTTDFPQGAIRGQLNR
jgi:CHRD domain